MQSAPNNLMEIDSFVEKFLQDCAPGIANLHRVHFHNNDDLSLRSLKSELMDELRTGCVTFLNKEYPLDEINQYLFYIVNDYCKKKAVPKIKKGTEYLCPACLFAGQETLVYLRNYIFKCDVCAQALKEETDPKKIHLFRTFFRHQKMGYHCQNCERFIPHPMDESPVVTCPYFDCHFVGSWASLKRMHHPNTQSNPEKLILDVTQEKGGSLKDTLVAEELSADTKLEMQEELEAQCRMLHDVIDSQKNSVPYSSAEFTARHKVLVYQAFENLLRRYPQQMASYLLHDSRSGGFQHKVFQEYVRLLEGSLPLTFKKSKKLFKIDSLLDENLNVFDGISDFTAIVSEKGVVKNGTREFYIGGRKAKVTRPYYIGKLLDVTDRKKNVSILDRVTDYTFSLVKFSDVDPGTEVIVSHLRVPPHYQMGGMVYVNRVRKKIVERARHVLEI